MQSTRRSTRSKLGSPLFLGGLTLLSFGLIACGGGGSTGAAFGLEGTYEVTGLGFDFGVGQPGAVSSVAAYPNLDLKSIDIMPVPDGSGRMLSLDKGGFGLIFDDDSGALDSDLWFDFSSKIAQGAESGLLAATFDPNYQSNGFLYLFYSLAGPDRSVLTRVRVDSDVPNPATEITLLTIPQDNDFHNGGSLRFGPDGYLYLGIGDDGSPALAQDLGSLKGKLLRLTDTGAPAPGNPFAGQGGARAEIFAYGLRNPWRLDFDSATGELWVADVGQEQREEIDLITAGGNYGWPAFEGSLPFDTTLGLDYSQTQPPLFEYDHTEGQSIIGGFVYRGTEIPSLFGAYIYTDSVVGRVWALVKSGNEVVSNTLIASGLPFPVTIGRDGSGEPLIGCLVGGQTFGLVDNGGGSTGGNGTVPPRLSETGVFTNLAALQIRTGFVPYEPNAPFWSDGAIKTRWIGLPPGGKIQFDANDNWTFPIGTVLVKHFELDLIDGSRRRLETRVMFRTVTEWEAYSYRWNEAQTDADLLEVAQTESYVVPDEYDPSGSVTVDWLYPSPAQCFQCHTVASGYALGPRTEQLNGDYDYPLLTDNQLRAWDHVNLFSTSIPTPPTLPALADPLDPSSGTVAERARAYLATNCSNCHQANGPVPIAMDLRASVTIPEMNTHFVAPVAGDLGLTDAARIAPFAADSSVVLERMKRVDFFQMPPLSRSRPDVEGIDLLDLWIGSGAAE